MISDRAECQPLMHALVPDAEECWSLYEEIGRIMVSHLLDHDRIALSDIVEAWAASLKTQGTLADTWPDSPRYAQVQSAAESSDARLFALIRKAVLTQN